MLSEEEDAALALLKLRPPSPVQFFASYVRYMEAFKCIQGQAFAFIILLHYHDPSSFFGGIIREAERLRYGPHRPPCEWLEYVIRYDKLFC